MIDGSLRPVNRSAQMSRVMQRLMTQPWAIHERHALMALAAIRGKYGIEMVHSGDVALDGPALDGFLASQRPQAAVDATRRRGAAFDEYDGVAIIPIEGTLVQNWGLDPWCGITGYDGIETKVIAAAQDSNIQATWLEIDSGGGDVSGLFDLCDVITAVNAKNGGKPIWAFVNEHAYSAAFAIATCADKVFMPRYGGVGSVGVITMHATYARQLKATGVDVTVIRAGEQKARANSVEELPDETRAHIQQQVDTIRAGFIKLVSDNMPGVTQNVVRETEGLDYMGDDARALGFVSGIMSWHQAWDALQRKINR